MMPMDSNNAAWARFAHEMSEAFAHLAAALDGTQPSTVNTSAVVRPMGRVSTKEPWNRRLLRQALIVNDIIEAGGSVSHQTWKDEIAYRWGYEGRGLAGFFRGGDQGLLEMRNGKVYVKKNGKTRLKQQKDQVDAMLASLEEEQTAVAN